MGILLTKQRPSLSILRVTFIFFILLTLNAEISFAEVNQAREALNKTISMRLENTGLNVVLREIEDRSGIHFIYSTQIIDATRKVTVKAKNKKLVDVLTDLLTPLRIDFEPLGGEVVLKRLKVSSFTPALDNAGTRLVTTKKNLLASTINLSVRL